MKEEVVVRRWARAADETSAFPGGADPGRGAERLAERLVGGEPAANQSVRIGDLRDVA